MNVNLIHCIEKITFLINCTPNLKFSREDTLGH